MFAAIDVGTNSVRLLIAEYERKGINYVYKDLKTTRLGEGVAETGYLQEKAIQRTVDALAEFQDVIRKLNVTKMRAVATSAAREAANGELLIKEAGEKGIKLEIISGKEEAELSFKGAISDQETNSNQLVVDIGGGSTEIIYCLSGQVLTSSTKAGAVRCTEGNWSEAQIMAAFQPVLEKIRLLPGNELIGVGGTITSLAAIDQKLGKYDPDLIHGYKLGIERVRTIRKELAGLPLAERRQVKGLQPARADIIVAGIDILLAIMSGLGQQLITVSEKDILDGIILELATVY